MLRIILLLKWKGLLAQFQYPANFFIYVIGVSLGGLAEIVMVLALTSTFETIGGWNFWEVGFMVAIFRLAYAVNMALFLPFWYHSWLIRNGLLDRCLLRPVHPLLQLLASDLPLAAIGILLPALFLFGLTYSHVAISWTLPNILFLVIVIVAGAFIQWAVLLILNTLDFWFTQADETVDLVETVRFHAGRFPLHIYGRVFSFILTFILPYAFMAYFPAHFFVGRQVVMYAAWFPYLSPFVATIATAIAVMFWSFGLRHYQSTGH